MKKVVSCILLMLMMLSLTVSVFGMENITVILDGKELLFDVPPQIINGRTMVPFRKIFEELDMEVEYEEETLSKNVTAENKYTKIRLCVEGMEEFGYNQERALNVGKKYFDKDVPYTEKSYNIPIDVLPIIIDGRTLVPIRIISEVMGCDVQWNGQTNTVTITSKDEQDCYVTVYSNDTVTKKRVLMKDVESYIDNGWSLEQLHTYHSMNGESWVGPLRRAKEYEAKGWYENNNTVMYAPDGRTITVPLTEVNAYLNVGWYQEPMCYRYTLGNKKIVVKQSEIAQHDGIDWFSEPIKILHSLDGRAIVVMMSEANAYEKVGWYDLEVEKSKYNLNTVEGITKFLKKFYPQLVTATGNYPLDYYIGGLNNPYDGLVKYPLDLTYNMQYNTNFSVDDRVKTKKEVVNYMRIMANDVFNRTNLALKLQYHYGGYEYPTIKVGYNSTNFCTCKNYKTNWVTAPDGTQMNELIITNFMWDTFIDDIKLVD